MVGLSAQAVLGNMVSGLNLYISRPFVAGKAGVLADRVTYSLYIAKLSVAGAAPLSSH